MILALAIIAGYFVGLTFFVACWSHWIAADRRAEVAYYRRYRG